MTKLYHPQSIIDTLFEEDKTVASLTVNILSSGESVVVEEVTVKSIIGDDESRGQYAMVEGTLDELDDPVGLKISPKHGENGDIIDIYASGNVANPYIFNQETAVVTNLVE